MAHRNGDEDRRDLERGARLFNDGDYWHAHEAWEAVWLRRRDVSENLFFKGLIQLAAAHHQRTQGRYDGFLIHLARAQEKLAPFGRRFMGVDLEPVLASIDACRSEALRLGRERLQEFDERLIPVLRFSIDAE